MAPVKLHSFRFSSSTTTIASTFIYIISPFTVHQKRKKSGKANFVEWKDVRPVVKKKVENQRNWVNDWIKYMMLFDLCVTFIRWTCVQWRTCHVMSALLHLKWLTKCLVLETRVARRKIVSPMCRDWMALFINNERQSFGLRDAISIGMNTTKRTPNVFAIPIPTPTTATYNSTSYMKWQCTYCCDACLP